MIEQICEVIHNDFVKKADIRRGCFAIEGGVLQGVSAFLSDGQYFRIVGSALNDGVYLYPAQGLADEVFQGEIRPMRVPKAVRALSEEISHWQAEYGETCSSPLTGERVLDVYSYQKSDSGQGMAWARVFRERLYPWRKLEEGRWSP